LWPYRWIFSHKPSALIEIYVEGDKPRTIDGMHKWLAIENQDYFEGNRRTLDTLFLAYQAATVLLAVSIALWLLDLAG
jgi:hypothetical protein